MKTVEELLKPRYKAIADYSDSPRKIGEILTYRREMAQAYDEWQSETTGECFFLKHDTIKKYPHLFRPLPWHAERKPEDMPEYVKHVNGGVFKVAEHCVGGASLEGNYYAVYINLQPATLAEYESFKQKQK